MAYLGRYGHQQYTSIKEMPITQVISLARSVNKLLHEEKDAFQRRMETDGV